MIEKKKFLIDQAVATSIIAAFQHAGVYIVGLKDSDTRKTELRKDLEKHLRSVAARYVDPVTEQEHCRNIEDLANTLTQKHKDTGILRDGRFRVGSRRRLSTFI
jgi:5S rRNA maturation endonuclease (ribonuclease M5)